MCFMNDLHFNYKYTRDSNGTFVEFTPIIIFSFATQLVCTIKGQHYERKLPIFLTRHYITHHRNVRKKTQNSYIVLYNITYKYSKPY